MEGEEDEPWFAPKRYGYGSGLPIAWQGWALLLVFIAFVVAAIWLFRYSPAACFGLVAAAAIAFTIVCARKTRGGWRWRWGEED